MRIINFFSIFSFVSILLSFTACGGGEDRPLSNEVDLNTTESVLGSLSDSPVVSQEYISTHQTVISTPSPTVTPTPNSTIISTQSPIVTPMPNPTIISTPNSTVTPTPTPTPSIFNKFNTGIGGSSSFGFISNNSDNDKIWISARALLLDDNISSNSYYKNIKNFKAEQS